MNDLERRPLHITGGKVVLPDRVVDPGCVRTLGTKITYAGPSSRDPGPGSSRAVQSMDARGGYVCPALVEMHIHGCGEVSFHDRSPGNRIEGAAGILARNGVGVFMPTVYADPSLVDGLAEEIGSGHPRVAGIYVEGPFVSPLRRGAIPPRWVSPPSRPVFDQIVQAARGHLRMMCLAPECTAGGGEWVPEAIRSQGAICSLGHSNALADDLTAFEDLTPLNITHLFNGMSGVSHRKPGLAAWALVHRCPYAEINGDGVHVHPLALELALRTRPLNRTILISDAVVEAGEHREEATYSGVAIRRRGNGMYYAENDVLVGSASMIRDVVGNVIRTCDLSVEKAVSLASRTPLELLGVATKGILEAGMDADIAVFDTRFETCDLLVYEGRIEHPRELTPRSQLRP